MPIMTRVLSTEDVENSAAWTADGPTDVARLFQIMGFYKHPFALLLQSRKLLEQQLPTQNEQTEGNVNMNPVSRDTLPENILILAAEHSYDYLYQQKFPKFTGRKWTQETSGQVHYNPLPSSIPQEGTRAFWKWQEQRLMAYSFCEHGISSRHYIECITDRRYTVGCSRLKGVIFGVIREAISLMQEVARRRLERVSMLIPPTITRILAQRLLFPSKILSKKSVATFLNIIKMHYYLPSSPLTEQDVMSLHAQAKGIMCCSKQYNLRLRLETLCQPNIVVKGELGVWDSQIDHSLVRHFIASRNYQFCMEKCLQEFKSSGQVRNFTVGQVKARIQCILKSTLRKVNYLMELVGVGKEQRIRNQRELNLLAKHPSCTSIHLQLLNFFLHPSLMDSRAILALYDHLRAARQLLQLNQCKRGHGEDGRANKKQEEERQEKDIEESTLLETGSTGVESGSPLRELYLRFQSIDV